MESVAGQGEFTVGDLIKLIKGFVDMVILASGCQSSGLPAYWDPVNLKKAFKWAFLIESVLSHLQSSSNSEDLLQELDASLSDLKSNPVFPQGLAPLSSATLARARTLLMEHLIQALPLREEHLKALMVASTEMDLDSLKENNEYDCLNSYLDNMILLSTSLTRDTRRRRTKDTNPTTTLSPEKCIRNMGTYDDVDDEYPGGLSELTVQKLLRRESSVSCLLTAETCLDILLESVGCGGEVKWLKGEEVPHRDTATTMCTEPVDFSVWKGWRSRSMYYFLSKRTVRLVSGASLIFSAPKTQWVQVFKQLTSPSSAREDNMLETLEIMLLGCIASRWESVVQRFTSVSYDWVPIPKQYLELRNLTQGRSRNPQSGNEMKSEGADILVHLTELLGSKPDHLLKLPPVLLAAAIPSWSPLLRLYLNQMEIQLKGEQIDCETAERIWCLYVFHVPGDGKTTGS